VRRDGKGCRTAELGVQPPPDEYDVAADDVGRQVVVGEGESVGTACPGVIHGDVRVDGFQRAHDEELSVSAPAACVRNRPVPLLYSAAAQLSTAAADENAQLRQM
jgi:hypothetical protein